MTPEYETPKWSVTCAVKVKNKILKPNLKAKKLVWAD
jgi:hypothetical protein